jgi:outer membrane protein OmpA-like peptidoglycan-associated protein
MDMAFGASYISGISNHFDYSVNAFLGRTQYPVRGQAAGGFIKRSLLLEVDASVHMKLLTDNYTVVPYLSIGGGVSGWNRRYEAFAPLGGGLQFNLGSGYFGFSNFQYRVPITQGANYHFLTSFGLGGPLTDAKPEVPKPLPPPPPPPTPAPPPAAVDTDGDGIVDDQDKCPTEKGTVKYQGCPVPDSDNDGINDEEDKCPKVKGLAKYQGCPIPDTDKDGVNDEEDKCPNVPGLARYNGCPIPDVDNDGINDEEDKCPTVPGVAEYRGCPAPKNFDAANVLFATGSTALVVKGKTELNKFVDFLKENGDIKITVAGHTDNTGGAALNQKLSEKRAASVKTYMVSKGVLTDRITSVGYGQDKPMADNKTAEGRKANRRVEFTIDD